jgi:hypothetical protein
VGRDRHEFAAYSVTHVSDCGRGGGGGGVQAWQWLGPCIVHVSAPTHVYSPLQKDVSHSCACVTYTLSHTPPAAWVRQAVCSLTRNWLPGSQLALGPVLGTPETTCSTSHGISERAGRQEMCGNTAQALRPTGPQVAPLARPEVR